MSDDPRLARYERLQRHIESSGFHLTLNSTLDDDDQECGPPRMICASQRFASGLSGNSFWVVNRGSQWFCGTWGGLCYRIPVAEQVGDMCVAWMIRNPDKTVSDFDDVIKQRFNLVRVSPEEIDSVPESSLDSGIEKVLIVQTVFQPSASLETLKLRARLLAFTRLFFDESGHFEVDTPLLSHERVIDPNIEPFGVSVSASERMYLQTSPEFAMKRLVASGAEAIYQLGKVFRRGELGRLHNPEFTMLEWYRVGDMHHDQMDFVERFVIEFDRETERLRPINSPLAISFDRLTYDEAFERYAGSQVLELPTGEIVALAKRLEVNAPDSLSPDDRDGWLNVILAERIEPLLGQERPTFIFDYPASQAALARVRGGGSTAVAERFELYVRGIEVCNGYHELCDADQLCRRIQQEAAASNQEIPEPTRLLAAMQHGLPACSGVALGFDRLLMLCLGHDSVRDVIPFPFDVA